MRVFSRVHGIERNAHIIHILSILDIIRDPVIVVLVILLFLFFLLISLAVAKAYGLILHDALAVFAGFVLLLLLFLFIVVLLFIRVSIFLLQAGSHLLECSLDEVLGVGEVVNAVLVVLIVVGVVHVLERRLVGVPSTLFVGKDSQFNTISIRRAHHASVQVKVAQHRISLLTLSKVSNPLRHLLIEFILALLAIIHLVFIHVAFVGRALVAVDVLLVRELTGDVLAVDLLRLAFGKLTLTAVFVLLFTLTLLLILTFLLITLLFFILCLFLFYFFFFLGVAIILKLVTLLAIISALVGVVRRHVGQISGQIHEIQIVLGVEVARIIRTNVEEHITLRRDNLTRLGVGDDILVKEVLVVGLDIDTLGKFERVGSVNLEFLLFSIQTTSADFLGSMRLLVRAGFL
mmetsp:Transcript_41959/g.88090  ORF Transcript_41959/g.88090 Transcript_41959/m.88090 type:complete len:404 (-) Transcript_41959:305-1516(-)